ncbi:hypothetical protein B0H14DRAFT_3880467 [Mycena olivaceomarginata]|nr:hypothetical protein B0H14DRAFT_3880467 [Mycena olivaceomarginata]
MGGIKKEAPAHPALLLPVKRTQCRCGREQRYVLDTPSKSLSICLEGRSSVAGASWALFVAAPSLSSPLPFFCACTPTLETFEDQYTALLYTSRVHTATPTPPYNFACMLAISCDYRPRAYEHVERVCPSLGPPPAPLRLSLLLRPSFPYPYLASKSSTPSPFLVSLLPPRLAARHQPTAQPHRSINGGWRCLPSRAAHAASRAAVLCGCQSASKMPSTRYRLCEWSRNPAGAHKPSHPALVLPPLPLSSGPALHWSTLDVSVSEMATSRPDLSHALQDWPRST